MARLPLSLTTLVLLCLGGALLAQPAVELGLSGNDNAFEQTVLLGDQPLLVYRFGADLPKPSVSSLRTLAGHEMLLYSPADHAHHRGLMFALGNVAFADAAADEPYLIFWGEEGEPNHLGHIATTELEANVEDNGVVLQSTNEWRRNSDDALVLTELRRITVHPPTKEGYLLTWESDLTAGARDLMFGGTPGAAVSYYGLGLRVAPDMDRGLITDANGKSGPADVNGDNATWCAYISPVEPARGFAMFDHPQNPRHPTGWFAMNDGFGYITASLVAHEPYPLKAGETVKLRYGLFVFDGQPSAETIAAQFTAWSKLP